MSELLRQYVLSHAGLDEAEASWAASRFASATVRRRGRLLSEGDRCDAIYFIERGALFSYATGAQGDIHVVQFGIEGYWISDLYSFFSGGPALFSIEAISDSALLALDSRGFEQLCDYSPRFERMFRVQIQNAYIDLQYRIAKTFSEGGQSRYVTFLQQHPEIAQRFPQYLVASYLGIRPQSLSRIRRRIAAERFT